MNNPNTLNTKKQKILSWMRSVRLPISAVLTSIAISSAAAEPNVLGSALYSDTQKTTTAFYPHHFKTAAASIPALPPVRGSGCEDINTKKENFAYLMHSAHSSYRADIEVLLDGILHTAPTEIVHASAEVESQFSFPAVHASKVSNGMAYYSNQMYYQQAASALREMLQRIDAVPIEVLTAISAYESGWGCSDIAKEFNNIWGAQTVVTRFDENDPAIRRREDGSYRRIHTYDTQEDSAHAFFKYLFSKDKLADSLSLAQSHEDILRAIQQNGFNSENPGWTEDILKVIRSVPAIHLAEQPESNSGQPAQNIKAPEKPVTAMGEVIATHNKEAPPVYAPDALYALKGPPLASIFF